MKRGDFSDRVKAIQERVDELRRLAAEGAAQMQKALPECLAEVHGALEQLRLAEEETTPDGRRYQELRRCEPWNRALLEVIPDTVFRCTRNGVTVDFKPAQDAEAPFTRDDLLGRPLGQVMPQPAAQRILRTIQQAFETQQPQTIQYQLQWNGNVHDYEGRMVVWGENEVVLVVRDVTERTRAEESLRESEERFRTVADFTYNWEYWVGPDAKYTYVSPSCKRITGYGAAEFLHDPQLLAKIAHPDDRAAIEKHTAFELEAGGEVTTVDFRIITRGGEERWLSHVCQPAYGSDGRWLGRRASIRDITEQKRAEDKLRHSEAQLAEAQRIEHFGSWSWDILNDEVSWTEELYRILGITSDEPKPSYQGYLERIHPDDRERLNRVVQGAYRDHEAFTCHYRIVRPDGEERTIHTRGKVVVDEEGNTVQMLGTAHDVTADKQAEEALRWELAVSKALAELSNALIAAAPSVEDIANTVLDCAKALTRSDHGYVSVVDPQTGDHLAHTLTAMMGKQCLVSGENKRIRFSAGPDGRFPSLWGHALNTRTAFYTNSPETHQASTGIPKGHIPLRNFLCVPAVVGDDLVGEVALANSNGDYGQRELEAVKRLTELYAIAIQRKRAEEALRESEERFRLITETVQDVFWVSTPGVAEVTYVSPGYEKVWGRPRDSLYEHPRSFIDAVLPEDRGRLVAGLQEHAQGRWGPFEYRVARPDGSIRWVRDRGFPIRDKDGKLLRMTGVATDITDLKLTQEALRKARDELERRVRERTAELTRANLALHEEIKERRQAEQALREQSRVLQAFFKHTITPLVFLDKEFNFIRVNEAYARACQRDVSEYPGRNHFEFYPSDAKAIFEEVVRTKTLYHAVARPFCFPDHPDWGVTYWDWLLVPILDSAGQVEFLVLSLEDVTQRKRAQDAAESERERLYSVLNVLPGYVAIVTADHAIRFANHRFLDMFGTPREKPCYVVQRRSDEPCENCPVLEILDTEHPQEWEWTDPQGRTYHVWGYPFPDPDGTVAVLQLGVNITERKELEKEVLEISEVERQRIGHDLHDTVGQNLTGAAFLSKVLGESLAAKRASEAAHAAKIEELLNQAIAQTRSVARGLSPVRMDADGLIPAMMELASSIEKVYGIRCTVNYTESVCPTDNVVATHLYRITQEAVNNAMKHGKAKNVHIALLGDDHSSIRLTIRDDGVGLPQDVDETKGIGMRIMRYRAGMIGASLQVQPHPDGGTVVECSLRLLNSRT